ncbi:MAG: DUF86 domain-containing protein, partial [Candidatus Sericytochromatia bacterium]|nr:DUF86 domain-containing protein [Candidatus Sericytochromatia bacterium]
VIASKLESLRRAVARVEARCPATPEALLADVDAQDIVSLNLTRAIQLCVDVGAHLVAKLELPVPETMGGVFEALEEGGILAPELASRLRRAVGFRNLAVHHYRAIDWRVVHALARTRLGDFAGFAGAIQAWLEQQEPPRG